MLASAVATVAVYLQALGYPFFLDDVSYITNNHKLSELHLTELWRLFTEPYNNLSEFLPLREVSYWLDMTLFGITPAAFRLHNILLYQLSLPLVYGVTHGLWRYFRPTDATGAPWAAAAVTALFALHPALVESVVWISGRKYILPNLFSLLALWFAVHARRAHGLAAPHAAAALAAFAAVMLSKSSYVAVAPVIALLWLLFWLDTPAPDRRRSQLLWPIALLLLAGLLVRIFISSSEQREAMYFGVEAVTRTLATLGWLARLAVSPEYRHYFYPVFEAPSLPVMVALGGAILVAATVGSVMLLRRRSLEGFALVVFLLLCMPYIHLIPYKPPSLVSDRWLALAVWPVMLLLVALSWRLKPVPRKVLFLAIALPWSFQTIERTHDWRSIETLIDADLRSYPGYYLPAAYKIMGVQLPQRLYREASETAGSITFPELRNILTKLVEADYAVHVEAVSTGNPQKAMTLLWQLGAEHKKPPVQAKWNSPINNLLAKTLLELTNEWGALTELFPDDVSVRYNAGLWMLNVSTFEEKAVTNLRAATKSQRLPESVRGVAFKNLGLALLNSGHIADAEAPLRAALEQSPPDLRAYCLLSKVYKQTKRFEEAARADASCPIRAPNEGALQ